jgi:hypothetical protein
MAGHNIRYDERLMLARIARAQQYLKIRASVQVFGVDAHFARDPHLFRSTIQDDTRKEFHNLCVLDAGAFFFGRGWTWFT